MSSNISNDALVEEKTEMLAYAKAYASKHETNLLEPTRLPNSAESFNYNAYKSMVAIAAMPYANAIR